MMETVCKLMLPIDEALQVKKTRLAPNVQNGVEKRVSFVTGTHGDELEGQYICYELLRRIKLDFARLSGIVDIYPAINPIGIDSVSRELPITKLDMNRTFDGNYESSAYGYISKCVVEDIKGSDICVDLHASDILTHEIPQVRIHPRSRVKLLPFAKLLNTDFIWVGETASVTRGSLAHALNTEDVPTLVIEMGIGYRITREYCEQVIDGLFAVMHSAGVWQTEEPLPVSNPPISNDGEVVSVYADKSGLFLPCVKHWSGISRGDKLGDIVNPYTGLISSEIISRASGQIFTLREYPIVSEGSLLARLCAMYDM